MSKRRKLQQTPDLAVYSNDGVVDNLLSTDASKALSANQGSVIQAALDLKAPLASPTLTGVPAAPTANAGTNTTQIATTAFVQTAVAGIVDTAPETLDTLNELAAALGDDPNFATTVSNSIGGKAPLTGEGTSGTWSISITGNANTVTNGVYTSGNQTIGGVKTFSNNAVFDGNVGIGTSTPLAGVKLEVASTGESVIATRDLDQANTYGLFGHNGGLTQFVSRNGSDFGQFEMYGTDGSTFLLRMKINDVGRIGIGTSVINAGLQVAKGITASAPSAGASSSAACFGNDTSSGNYGLCVGADGFGKGYISAQRTDGVATVYDLRIQPNGGNVGIGGTPGVKLDVFDTSGSLGSTRDITARFYRLDGIENPRLEIRHSTSGTDIHHTYSSSASNLTFSVGNSEHVRIDGNGFVGVGTASPSQKFSVDGGNIKLNHDNANANYYLQLNKKEGRDGGLILQRDNTNDWQIVNNTTTGNLGFYAYGAGSQVVLIERATGNVGIGTTSPSSKLQVNGTITCTSLTETSSLKFKENIKPIDNALGVITKLDGVLYDLKDGSATQRSGLIAEHVNEILPNLVQLDDNNEPYGIHYTNLIAYLIESIKELNKEIIMLKAK